MSSLVYVITRESADVVSALRKEILSLMAFTAEQFTEVIAQATAAQTATAEALQGVNTQLAGLPAILQGIQTELTSLRNNTGISVDQEATVMTGLQGLAGSSNTLSEAASSIATATAQLQAAIGRLQPPATA